MLYSCHDPELEQLVTAVENTMQKPKQILAVVDLSNVLDAINMLGFCDKREGNEIDDILSTLIDNRDEIFQLGAFMTLFHKQYYDNPEATESALEMINDALADSLTEFSEAQNVNLGELANNEVADFEFIRLMGGDHGAIRVITCMEPHNHFPESPL